MTEMAEGKQSGYRQLFVNLENNVYRGASQPWNRQLYLHEGDMPGEQAHPERAV